MNKGYAEKIMARGISREELFDEHTCSKCGKSKEGHEFRWAWITNRGKICRTAQCTLCKDQYDASRNQGAAYRAKCKAHYKKTMTKGDAIALRQAMNQRIRKYRQRSGDLGLPPMSVDVDYLVALFHNQKGKCYYTQQPLVFNALQGKTNRSSMSLDRIVPIKGYTKRNVVWCLYGINTAKGKLGEDEFYAFCKQVITNTPSKQ